jgi:hypothetical protein
MAYGETMPAGRIRLASCLTQGAQLTPCLQVSFTADLKAFSDYGLVTPVLSPKKQDRPIHRAAADPSSAAVRSARKRNANRVQSQDAIPKLREGMCADDDGPAEASSLAERVKKRRRVSQAPR